MSLLRKFIYQIPKGPLREAALQFFFGRSIEETALLLQFFNQLPERSTRQLVDVGSHYGQILEPFAKEGWKVLAFEPDESNRTKLLDRVRPYSNVIVDHRAVSNEAQSEVPFFTSEESTGISSLSAFRSTHEQAGTIEVTTLALALAEHAIKQVDLLKTDTEGYDLFALQGFDWNSEHLPIVIISEFEDRKTVPLGYRVSDMVCYLQDHGYDCLISEWHPIVAYGQRHQWKRFTQEIATVASDSWGNVIAIQPSHSAQLMTFLKANGLA